MALLNQSVQVYAKLGKLLEALREGQAPEKFTREFLRDIGFKSSNDLAFIPLLKGLGFLAADGTPTQRYKEFLDPTKWKKVVAESVREAYSDIFVIKSKPTKSDRKQISGKYRSTYNLSENSADRAAGTFLALLALADEDVLYGAKISTAPEAIKPTPPKKPKDAPPIEPPITPPPAAAIPPGEPPTAPSPEVKNAMGLHYNIQVHLPATKDVEVYNAIFKALREHLID